MKVIEEMLHKALRDDSTATVGIRALLGHPATPYGVVHTELPENPDFTSSKKYITHNFVTGSFDMSAMGFHNFSTALRQETYQITAWGGDTTTSNDDILARVFFVLANKHKTTNPTSNAAVLAIKPEWEGPEQYDEDFKLYYKSVRYRVWVQDDTIK